MNLQLKKYRFPLDKDFLLLENQLPAQQALEVTESFQIKEEINQDIVRTTTQSIPLDENSEHPAREIEPADLFEAPFEKQRMSPLSGNSLLKFERQFEIPSTEQDIHKTVHIEKIENIETLPSQKAKTEQTKIEKISHVETEPSKAIDTPQLSEPVQTLAKKEETETHIETPAKVIDTDTIANTEKNIDSHVTLAKANEADIVSTNTLSQDVPFEETRILASGSNKHSRINSQIPLNQRNFNHISSVPQPYQQAASRSVPKPYQQAASQTAPRPYKQEAREPITQTIDPSELPFELSRDKGVKASNQKSHFQAYDHHQPQKSVSLKNFKKLQNFELAKQRLKGGDMPFEEERIKNFNQNQNLNENDDLQFETQQSIDLNNYVDN